MSNWENNRDVHACMWPGNGITQAVVWNHCMIPLKPQNGLSQFHVVYVLDLALELNSCCTCTLSTDIHCRFIHLWLLDCKKEKSTPGQIWFMEWPCRSFMLCGNDYKCLYDQEGSKLQVKGNSPIGVIPQPWVFSKSFFFDCKKGPGSMHMSVKATNEGTQWCSDIMMQTLIYLGTSCYFNTKSTYCLRP